MSWSCSTNEETYNGKFETREMAISAALAKVGEGEPFWVGECRSPIPPETYFDIDAWIEQVDCQDDYSPECAEHWFCASKEQIAEVEAEVAKVLGAWLDRHNLRPAFWLIRESEMFRRVDGKAMKMEPFMVR
jgi:hypothetical protein